MKCLFLSPPISFSLKSILSDTRTVMHACFLVPFDCNTLVLVFTLQWCVSLKVRCAFCSLEIDFFVSWSVQSACIFWLEHWGNWYLKLLLKHMYYLWYDIIEFWCCCLLLGGTLCFNNYVFIFLSAVLGYVHSSLQPEILLPVFIACWL